jgi:hypothetical protein
LSYSTVQPVEEKSEAYTFYMYDSYGDGWNGATVTLTYVYGDSEIDFSDTGYLTRSDWDNMKHTFSLQSGIYSLLITSGSWPGELSWKMTDSKDEDSVYLSYGIDDRIMMSH